MLSQLVGMATRLSTRRRAVRLRLTLLSGGLFLASGAALLAVTYVLVDHGISCPFLVRTPVPTANLPVPIGAEARSISQQLTAQQTADLHQFFIKSVIALAIMAVVSVALGWLVAGRVLRPLRTMTNTTQEVSEENLHRRLALQGPRDEMKDLGDTIDGLLGRLEGAFDVQRRLVANASHELRTPLTVGRAMLEVTLADPAATIESFRSTCEEVVQSGEQQERLIEALLT